MNFKSLLSKFWPSAKAPLHWGGIEWSDYLRGNYTTAGVSESTARSVSTVLACTNIIGGTIAIMPLHFFRQTADGKEKFRPNEWWLFNERAHAQWSAAAFWQYISDSRLLYGDGFAVIHRASTYSPTIESLEPWHPQWVEVRRQEGRLKYRFTDPNDSLRVLVKDQDDVLHFPGCGFNGIRSISQLSYGLRTAAGIAEQADQQSLEWFSNGNRPDFAIEIPGQMSREQREVVRTAWVERHSGQKTDKPPVVLSNGMKLHQLTLNNEDSQLIESRSFQVEEICRVFGVPPHMVGHTEKTTSWGSGVEQMSIGFIKYTMQRHLAAYEQEINYKLYKTVRHSVKFATAGLERGDIKTRNEAYRIALGRAGEDAWMTLDEVRELEDLPKKDIPQKSQAAKAEA